MKNQNKTRIALATGLAAMISANLYCPPRAALADDAAVNQASQTPNKPAASSGDAVPDWLKEIDKSDKGAGASAGATPGTGDAPQPATDQSGAKPGPGAAVPQAKSGSTSGTIDNIDFTRGNSDKAGASQAPSAKVAPPVTTSLAPFVPPAGTAPHGPAAAVSPKPMPLKPGKMLVGRLEEIGGYGAKLPINLQLKSLKAQAAKVDPSGLTGGASATQLQGTIASFPMDWRGTWSGPLVIHDSQTDPVEWQFDPEEAQQTKEILHRGATPMATFSFSQSGKKISLEPGKLVFPPHQSAASQRELQQAMQGSPLAGLFGGANSGMFSMLTSGVPIMYLGEFQHLRGVGGTDISASLLRNNVRQLKEGVIEENIIARISDKSNNTGKTVQKIQETVLRFTRLNQNQLYVQAAQICYRNDGHFLSKVLFYGTISRGAAVDPLGIPGMGSFPGMTPSGGSGGGLDAIQQMMKQLQGM